MGLGKDELLEPTEADEDLYCPICVGILVDAVACTWGHTFCRRCFERVLDVDPRCPTCRRGIAAEDVQPCNLINLRVNSLVVCCDRRCGWYGRRDCRWAHTKVCPVAKATEFIVAMQGHLGLTLDHEDGQNLVVSRVDEGDAQRYNKSADGSSSKQIGPGTIVVEADGVRGDPYELLHVIEKASKAGGRHRLVFRQPTEFCATINKHSNKLGLVLGVSCQVVVPFLIVQRRARSWTTTAGTAARKSSTTTASWRSTAAKGIRSTSSSASKSRRFAL